MSWDHGVRRPSIPRGLCPSVRCLQVAVLNHECHEDPQEPRVLADSKTAYVQTRSCGLHRITGLDTVKPRAEAVWKAGFVVCQLWLATIGSRYSIVPRQPVSELVFPQRHLCGWDRSRRIGHIQHDDATYRRNYEQD